MNGLWACGLVLSSVASAAPTALRGTPAANMSLRPLRAVAYGALPCSPGAPCSSMPPEDMLQSGYAEQWGPEGRNDLGMMQALGANGVRLYHSFGLNSTGTGGDDHSGFLDRAHKLGLNVMPGVHSNDPKEICPDFDCYAYVKDAVGLGFQQGFSKGSEWHPAVGAIILLNEPDFYENDPMCLPSGPWCRVKAAISALDGLLAAEEEHGVQPGRVKITVTWSFAMRTSIDGEVEGPGTFGFQDMVAAVANTSIAQYTLRTPEAKVKAAFQERWINGLNTQAPWTFVRDFVSQHYERFRPVPWFIGEYGANGQTDAVIKSDLQSMDDMASAGGEFLGAAVFQFQSAYIKGGSELNFGLFSLGESQIGETGELCDRKTPCKKYPVYCLKSELPWLPGAMGLRAEAVAAAWSGTVGGPEVTSAC